MIKLALIAFGLLIVQGILSYRQTVGYQRRVVALRSQGVIGIGVQRGRIKPGAIAILVCSPEGVVIKAEKMEGYSIFARFKTVPVLIGKQVKDLQSELNSRKAGNGTKAILKAMEQAEKSLGMA